MRVSSGHIFLAVFTNSITAQSSALFPSRRNASSVYASSTHLPVAAQQFDSAAHNFSLYDKLPGLWFEVCTSAGGPPCTAYCHENDTICQDAGRAVTSTCGDLWNKYDAEGLNISDPEPGWSTFYTTYGQSSALSSTTVDVYTTYSTASEAVVKQNLHTDETNHEITITPVYALGQPSPSVSVATVSEWAVTTSWLTAPKPSCRYIAMSTSDDCGKCSIYGGSVELYFWPPMTSTDTASPPVTTRSIVLTEGVTLFSPTVYISLSTVYASNSCTQIGRNHTGTLLAMNPTDVSTQVHIGGKVAATGANYYDKVNYADLMGVPPVTDYENQPSCIMFGCSTILPTFNPTLVVPLALRSLDPAWSSCGAALQGLYDPPIALTEQAVEASPTMPSQNTAGPQTTAPGVTSVAAIQCSSPSMPTPVKTNDPKTSPDPAPSSDLADELATVIANGRKPSPDATQSRSAVSTPNPEAPPQMQSGDAHTEGAQTSIETAQTVNSPSSRPSPNLETERPSEHTTAVGGYIASILSMVRPDTTLTAPGPNSQEHAPSESPGPSRTNAQLQTEQAGPHDPAASDPAELVSDSAVPDDQSITRSGDEHSRPSPAVSQDEHGNFVVDGMTLAPGSPITLSNGASLMTVHMNTTNGDTLIELGTTQTATLGVSTTSKSGSSSHSGSAISTSKALPSLASPDPSTTTSRVEPPTASMSSAHRHQGHAFALTMAVFALSAWLIL